ncbi:MAG TPA: peptidoglycan DD-metalloendopeptidase family protein [Candidatus Cybelea sp.]|nr:peptidoglycan DD-metalloendopeptidase family protein [Candidatus Cybelea sp.]
MTGRVGALAALVCVALAAGCEQQQPSAPIEYRAAPGVVPPAQRMPEGGVLATAPRGSRSVVPPAQRSPGDYGSAPRVAAPAPGMSAPSTSAPAASAVSGATPPASVRAAPGDTVFTIAQREKVPVRALVDANNLVPPYTLSAGQTLIVPRAVFYTVQRGDTLYSVSRRYSVDLYSLAQANGIPAPYRVTTGRRLRIPAGPDLPESAQQAVPTPPPAAASPAVQPPPATEPAASARASDAKLAIPSPPPRAGKTFAWPVRGQMISNFGTKPGGLHNDGINIAVGKGAEVRAAENGVVVYSGNELRGYGKLLLIRHADGWMTAYAHNDELLVHRGDMVRRGQVIAHAGATGNVTRPQLHFEIRHGVQAVDPVPYLSPSA